MTIQVTNTDNVDQNSNADLATAQSVATYTIGGTTYLYVGNENTGNISVYSVAANGTLTYQSTLDTGSISLFFEAVDMKIAEVGGHTYLIALSDFGSTIGVFSVDTTVGGNGALSIASNINDDLTTNFLSPTAIEVATVGGTTYVFVVADSENSLTVFSIAADGTLTEVDSVIDDETLLLRGATSVALAEVGGTTYAFVGSLFDDGVSVFSVANDGSLTHVQNVPDGGTNSLLQTVAMTTAEVDGTTYLVVSARFDDTLTVFSVGDDGTLTKAFEVSNTISNRLNSPIELISATFGGATYIFSGSNIENGFSVFLLGADGSLSDVANLADDATVHLDNPTQSTTVVIGGTPYLISVGNDDHGVSVFQISDLPTPGAPSTPDLAVASDTGQSDSDNLTADDTPTFTGTAQVGSTVRIFVDGVEIAQGVAVDGTYSLTPADRLADGTYAITATATNAEGEASAASAALNVTIDATAPGGFSTVGNNSRVNDLQSEHQAEQVATSLADGSYVVVWTSYDSSDDGSGFALKAKIFNSNGFQAGPEFQVTTQTIESQQSPTVTTLSNGNFVVVWRTEDPTQDGSLSALKMQIFLPDGTKSGAETLVNTQFTDFQVAPSVSALGNGGIVVTWQTHDTTQDGSGQAIKAAVFDSNGTQVGTEFLVNTETDSNQIEPEVTALPDGGFVVAWQSTDSTQDGSDSAIKAQRFDDAGTKLGAEFLVNSEFDGSQVMRSITALANGGFVVAWDTNDTTQDGSGQAVKARVFASDGTPAGNEFLLNTNATGDQAFVTLTALSTGGFVAAWRSIESTTFTIPVQVFDDTGKRVGPETTINGITNSYNGLPDLVDLGNGRFVALWDVLTGSDTEVYAQILELNAPKLSLTSDLDQDGRTENLSPSITFTAEAGATLEIDWDDGNGFVSAGTGAGAEQTKTIPSAYSAFGAKALKLRITDAAGNSATQPLNFTVEDGTPPTAPNTPDLVFSSDSGALSDDNITNDTTPAFEGVGAEAGATLRLYANGTLVGSTTVAANGTWSLTSSVLVDGVYDFTATATDAAGNTSPASTALSVTIDTAPPGGSEKDGTEFQVTTEKVSNQDFPVGTLLSDGSHILVWQTQDPAQDGTFHAIKAQRFAADGSPLGTEFLVNTNTAGAETLPAVTALQNGNYVVTWNTSDTTLDTDGASVRGQIFAPDGTKVGSEFQVNQQFALEQNYSSITTLEGGAFVVLWNSSDATQDGSGSAIKGRIFQEDGTGGAEFLVNTNSAEGQLYPKVSDLPGGGFVATWITMDTTADGSDWAIKAQRFDAAGAKVGAEFLVNTDATDRQNAPSVATLENGSFVITWHTQDSTQDGSSYAIKARIYDSNGVAAQGEFLVNSETDNQQDLAHVAALSGGGFVIAWRTLDTTQDGSLSAIKAQQFDANGSKIGSESLVNTIPDLLQTNPHIVGLADDRFVITWSSTHDASVSNFQNIQAQVFKPAVPSLTLAADPDADGQTTDTTPTIAFFAEPGTLVEVNWGDGNGYVVSGNGTGAVQEATIPTAYTTFGAKFVQVRITDLAGNSTIKSLDFTLLPPQPDAPTAPVLDASSDTGASNSDLLTNDTTPTFTGSGVTPGDTVTLLADGTAIGTALADAGGTWQITATPLVAGALDITATVTNGTNQTSDPSPALSITIDTTAPNAPAAVDLVAASDSGASDTDNVTVDDTPTFEGSGVEPGARVTIFADGTPVGTGTADASGNWSVTSAALSGGQHAITATQTDAAGNSSVASLALQVTVDTTAPTITAQDITIQIGSGGVTLITAQDIDSGSADNIALSSLTLDQSSFDTSDIGSAITVTLTGTDVAGNQASDTALVTVEPRATFAFDATALTQTEGDSGSQPVQFSITRTGDTSDLASVTISRSGTADNSDVTSGGAATFTVDFQPGEATVTLDPAILGDTNFEPDETLVYTITNVPLGSQIGGANAATLTIQNDDQPAANLFVSANTGSEAGATLITVTVTSNAPVAGDQTVDLAVTGVQAGDFILSDTTITILDGQTTGTATFTVVDDSVFDGPETAVLTLSNPSAGLSLGTTTSQSITITDNDETASTIVTTAADVVDSTDGVTSLREAVAHANAGDTITFDSSLSTITLDEDIVINKQITIDGDHTGSDGKADITLTTDGDNRHFNVQSGGTLNLHSLTLTDGVVTAGGGSVLVNTGGILSIEQSTFSGNSGVSGGAILSLGSVTVSDSTFSMNSAISPSGGSGGAINIGDGSLNATNSSFVGNTASGGLGGSGGAIFRGLSAGTVSLTQVTLTGNSADAGGAIEGAGAVQLTNTIVSGNTAGTGANIRSVTVNDLGGNILNGDVATIFAGSTPALADNGGPVQTVALLAIASNPALDVASTGPGTDARGQARSDIPGIANGGGAIDAGAYELLLSDLPNRVNLSVSQTSASEASATTVTVTVTADFQVSGDQTLSLNVTGTADAADHSALPSTISILDGQTTGTATFTLIDDPDDEPSETVILTLSNPSAGITLGSTIVQTVTILDDDVITPSVPDLLGSSDTGVSDSDDVTSDATPTFTGTAKPLDTVTLFADGTPVGTATADGAGNWTITTSPLPAGATSITAHASDGAGNQSSLSAGLTITVDNAAPAAPSVTGITSDTGTSGDGITADNTLTYNGTAQANTSVALFMDGTPLGTVQANGSGHWSFSAPSTLTDGTYTITAQATDLAGNTSAISTGFPLTVDTAAPAAPIITGVTQDTGTPGDGITSDFTPTLSGTAEPNTQLELYRDGVSVGTIPVNGAGTWNFASTTLANGTYVFTARVTDLAGNTSPASAPLSVTVDAAAPAAPIIIGISDDTGTAGDGTTSDDTPTLSGTAEADTSIELFRDGVSLGTVKADGSGMWSFASATLADGDYSFTARATDAAGNASALSTAVSVTIDTGAPPAPTISAIAGDTGTPGDGITSDATPTLSGTAEPHASLEVFIDGVSAGIVQADAAGAWSFAATNLPDGNYSFTAQATDLAGNVSAVSSVFPVVINTSAPAAPVISGISADTGTPGDGITSDNSPTLSGTGEPNATVEVFRDGVSIGTQTVNSSGSWSMVVTTLTDGTYDFSAQLTDAAGNTSARSSDFAVTVDTSIALLGAPDLLAASDSGASDSDDITRETTPTFTGTGAEAGVTIYLLSDQDGSIGTTTADGSGAWQITASILSNGAHAISAVQSDLAGNSSLPGATLAIIVDTSTPAAPVIAGFSDDTGTPGDGITIDSTPTLSGTADANTTVELLRDGVLVDTTQADASGTWSITSPALPGGVYAFTARAVTAAGNASAPSGATQITISTSGPPSVLSIAQNSPAQSTTNADTLIFRVTFSEDVQGVNAGDFAVTGGTTATVSQITPVSGAVYDVQISGGDLQGFNGTVGLSLTDDDSITSVLTGLPLGGTGAGNGNATEQSAYTLDNTAPALPAPDLASASDSGVSDSDNLTNITTPTFTGTGAEAGAAITLRSDVDGVIGTATADNSGNWQITATALSNGPHAISATQTDLAGNTSTTGAQTQITIDGSAPAVPVIASITPDTGVSGMDFVTNQTALTISGTAEAGATVTLRDQSGVLGTATADTGGNWLFSHIFTAGTTQLTATASDAAGNSSAPTAPRALIVDTVIPGAASLVSISDDDGSSAMDLITQDSTLSFAGIAATDAALVEVFLNGVSIGTTSVAGGFWSLDHSGTILPLGDYNVTVQSIDTAGNRGALSAVQTVSVVSASQVPSAPDLSAASDSGVSQTDDITSAIPILTGSASAGALVRLFAGSAEIGTATADASGNWSFTANSLTEGVHSLTARAENAAGALSAPSAALSVTVDRSAPTVVTQNIQVRLDANGQATITSADIDAGSSDATGIVSLQLDRANFGSADLGANTVTLTAQDAAGNAANTTATVTILPTAVYDVAVSAPQTAEGHSTRAITYTVSRSGDTSAPATVILAFSGTADGADHDRAGAVLPVSFAAGATTAQVSVQITGDRLVEPDETIKATLTKVPDGSQIGTASATHTIVNDDFDNSRPPTPDVPDLLASSDTGQYQSDDITRDVTPTLSGQTEAGATVTVTSDRDGLIGTQVADGSGNWQVTTSALSEGLHQITVVSTDAAGNASGASAPLALTVDTTAPATPGTPDLAASSDSGVSNTDNVTGINTPVFSGNAGVGETVTLHSNVEGIVGTATTDASGVWQMTSNMLRDGTHLITASATDIAGNISMASSALPVTVATGPGVSPLPGIALSGLDLVAASDTGPSNSDNITADTTPTLSFVTEAGKSIEVDWNDGRGYVSHGTSIAGAQTVSLGAAYDQDGAKLIRLRLSDPAGNEANAALSISINRGPTGATLSNARVVEQAVAATIVGSFAVADPTPGEQLGLILLDDAGGLFMLNGSTLTVAAGPVPDFQTAGSHQIVLQATDSAGQSLVQAFTITVLDLPAGLPGGGPTIVGSDGPDTLTGSSGDEVFIGGPGTDTIDLGTGRDIVIDSLTNLNGDTLIGFGLDDALIFTETLQPGARINFDPGPPGRLLIDQDADGTPDVSINLPSNLVGGTFLTMQRGNQTILTYETFLPTVSEGQSIDPSQINGVNNQMFLTGDGTQNFSVQIEQQGGAGFNNAFGFYEVSETGVISDVTILFGNVNAARGMTTATGVIDAGHKLGFFLIQNGADFTQSLENGDVLEFINDRREIANADADTELLLTLNGQLTGQTVMHSYAAGLNIGGHQQVMSGVTPDGRGITLGFEDLILGDQDFQDVLFTVFLA